MNQESTEGAISISADMRTSTINPNPITPETPAERLELFCEMRESYRPFVRDAIWKIVQHCEDLGLGYDPVQGLSADPITIEETIDEIERDVWVKVFENFDAWLQPGFSNIPGRKPAKLSTRLAEFAMWQARAWKKTQLRDRSKFVGLDEGARIEHFLVCKAEGYGRLYPQALHPHPLDETPKKTTRIPFDHAARFFCAQCGALQLLAAGLVVEEVADPAFVLRCGHTRRLSGTAVSDRCVRAA